MDLQEALTELTSRECNATGRQRLCDDAIAEANELSGRIALTLLATQNLPAIADGDPVAFHFLIGHHAIHIYETSRGWELAHETVIAVSPATELKESQDVD
jgi:hypothetical protein